MNGVAIRQGWRLIEPDAHGDWLSQRDGSFAELMAMGDKDEKERVKLFASYSAGVKTQRDWWAYNPSRTALGANIGRMIDAYNAELMRFDAAHPNATRKEREDAIDRFVDTDSRKISWTRALKDMAVKGRPLAYNEAASTRSLYRPFTPQALYFDRALNEMVCKIGCAGSCRLPLGPGRSGSG